ncbi:hypothetical protein GmHk_19G054681 [Glycine max]|nr:hypothetical protein GmHk_19G054681 [Glycine max]
MGTPPTSPPQSNVQSKAMLRRLTLRTLDKPRPTVNVDTTTGRGSGPHKEKFHNYLGVVALEKIPIAHNNWKDVPDWLKELEKFDILEALNAKKKGIRKKMQEIQKYNDYPHILSHGRYDLLEKKLLDEKTMKRQHDAMMTKNPPLIDDPLSPIQRHVKWKMAHTKPYRQMTSKAAKEIYDKIVNHGGRVHAAGSGVTITQYYGRTSRASNTSSVSISQEQMAEIIGSIREEVRNEIEEEKKRSLEAWKKELKDAIIIEMSQKGSKVSTPNHTDINVLGARVSTKESNVETGVNRSGEEHVAHVTPTMGLYVQCQHSTQLVALAKIFDGASTIHCVLYADDVVRVSVEKVINGEADVPFLTSAIKYLRQALHTFNAWPTPLVKLVSNEDLAITPNEVPKVAQGVNDVAVDNSLCELIKSLVDIYDKPVQFVWDVSKFGIPHVDSFLFLAFAYVNEITTGDKCLNIAILQLWNLYMDEWSDSLGHRSLYGFLEPQSIHNAKDRHRQCEEYIEKWLKESHRQVYLGAYLNQAHWQLIVLCPTHNVVVWFCSLRKRPDFHIKTAINNAFKTLNTTTDGKVHQTTPQWIEVKSHVQRGGYEYGYYWFGDGTALDTDTMTALRQKWAAYFLKLKVIQCKKL